jgi:galactokinase
VEAELYDRFNNRFGAAPTLRIRAPGRINLLGGHTDYNSGLALPAAIDRSILLQLRPRSDRAVRIHSEAFSETLSFTLGSPPAPSSDWQRYVLGALDIFPESPGTGFDAIFDGDIPQGSGLSSSAALLVAWMLALRALCGTEHSDLALCRLCQEVEHTHLGVACGLLDPIGVLCPPAGAVVHVDFADLSMRPVYTDMSGLSWVVLHTGVHRSLASSAYSQRVAECAAGVARIQQHHPQVRSARDVTAEMLDGSIEHRRLRHVLSENARVEQAAALLEAGRPAALGPLLLATHESLRTDYAVSCPELDALVELAAAHPAGLGGRLMGGGFGGCTVNLVQTDGAAGLIDDVLAAYHARFPHTGRGFIVQVVGGARIESG